VAGALDHDLDVLRPRAAREVAEDVELGELGLVAGVVEAAGTQAVAERDGDVVAAQHVEQLVVVREERVLLVVVEHPLRGEGAAAGDDSGEAAADEGHVLEEDAAVECHVVDALLGLLDDHLLEALPREVLRAVDLLEGLVDRHRPDGDRRPAQDRLADADDVAARREVHHRVGAVLEAHGELLELAVGVADDRAVADVRVDLARGGDADRHGHELGWFTFAGMIIRPRRPAADELGSSCSRAATPHLLGDDLSGVAHLSGGAFPCGRRSRGCGATSVPPGGGRNRGRAGFYGQRNGGGRIVPGGPPRRPGGRAERV
jgi:hypothetical protein